MYMLRTRHNFGTVDAFQRQDDSVVLQYVEFLDAWRAVLEGGSDCGQHIEGSACVATKIHRLHSYADAGFWAGST